MNEGHIRKSTCKACNEAFFYTSSDRSGQYCSLKCYWSIKCLPIEKVVCKNCTEVFEFRPFKGRMERDFCSSKCYHLLRKNRPFDFHNLKGKILDRSVRNENGCLIYSLSINSSGYGSVWYGNTKTGVHRAIWMMQNGKIPKGMVIAHRCDSKKCCEISHLFLATQKENQQDCIMKGRKPIGIDHVNSKYTEDQIRSVKQLIQQGLNDNEIFKKTGVLKSSIQWIRTGNAWKHITI